MPPNKRSEKPKFEVVPEIAGETSPWYRWMFYGRPRTGKTILAASACEVPEMSPVLAISSGPGINTIRGEQRFKDVQIVTLTEFTDINEVHTWLAPVEIGGGGHCADYGTIILDEIDDLWLMDMRRVMAGVVAIDSSRDPDVPSQREYGQVRSQILRVIDEFFKLPCHVLITGWAEYQPDPVTNSPKLLPSLPGKLGGDVPGRCDGIVYMSVDLPRAKPGQKPDPDKTAEFVAHFAPSPRWESGVWGPSRAKRLGPEMVNPSMAKMWALLENK